MFLFLYIICNVDQFLSSLHSNICLIFLSRLYKESHFLLALISLPIQYLYLQNKRSIMSWLYQKIKLELCRLKLMKWNHCDNQKEIRRKRLLNWMFFFFPLFISSLQSVGIQQNNCRNKCQLGLLEKYRLY